MKKKVIISIIITALLTGGYIIYKKQTARPGIQVFETAKAGKSALKSVLNETGIVKSQVGAIIKVGARATGTLTMMKVKIGDKVKKGELIAVIDDRELLDAIEQQKAAIETAKENLAEMENTYPKRIAEAKANYEYAKTNYERETELIKHEYTTKENVDAAKSKFDASDAVYKRLQEESRSQAKIAKSTILERTAALNQIKTRHSYTKIHAPIDGIVSDVTARDGETIVAGLQVANLITIIDPKRLEMWIYVDETDIGRIKTGMEVEYTVDTYTDKVFKGSIHKLYPQPMVKDNIVYYLAIVKVTAEDAVFLKPEMTAHVKIVSEEKSDIIVVPNAAVKYESGAQVVYKKMPDGQIKRTSVKIGIMGEDMTEIINGINEGDVVATKLLLPQATGQPSNTQKQSGGRPH